MCACILCQDGVVLRAWVRSERWLLGKENGTGGTVTISGVRNGKHRVPPRMLPGFIGYSGKDPPKRSLDGAPSRVKRTPQAGPPAFRNDWKSRKPTGKNSYDCKEHTGGCESRCAIHV